MAYSPTEVQRIGLPSGEALVLYIVSPDAATGNITLSAFTTVKVWGIVALVEDSVANAQVTVQALENVTTTNQVDFKLWQATNSAAAAYKDFRVLLHCIK